MKKLSLAAAASLCLLAAACSTPPRPETPKPECTLDSECAAGQVCGPAGKCTAECAADADCDAPETCQAGACVLPAGLCRSSSECGANELCGATDQCVDTCQVASDCAPTEACIAGGCLKLATQIDQCNQNSDCPGTQGCVNGRCAAACATTRDCPVGSECVNSSCVLPVVECLLATDCGSGEACSPGGQCVTACTTSSSCASTEACSNGACVLTGTSVAAISGSVTLTGQTSASGITVKLDGINRATATTANDGTYKFDGLTAGVYRLTYSASATVEGTLTRDLFAKTGQVSTVPTVTFTPAGAITGTATLQNKTNHTGINVLVSGTARGTVTDASGNFRIDGLPAGTYSVVFSAAGYLPQTRNNIAVTYNGTASVTGVTLNEPPTATGQTFAFVSVPPSTVRVGRAYNYTAQAAGAGVTSVTYGLTVFPTGMTIDPSSGAVSYTPTNTTGTNGHTVAISASGGGVTIYQVFTLNVTPGYEAFDTKPVIWSSNADGGAWVANNGFMGFFDGGSVSSLISSVTGTENGTPTKVELLNGGNITNVTWPGGKISSFSGPFGISSGSFEGGTVQSVASLQTYAVASKAVKTFPISTYVFDNENVITSMSYPTGTIATISDNRRFAFTIKAQTGVVSSIATNVLTDSNANWTVALADGGSATNQLVGSCVMDTQRSVAVTITANDATTITVGATTDLSQLFPVGSRYFVGPCTGTVITYTLEDLTATFTGVANNRGIDIYTDRLFVGNFRSTGVPNANSITFTAPPSRYSELVNAATNGGSYLLMAISVTDYTDVTLTDPTANFPAGLTSSRLGFDDFNTTYQIISNTPTSITYRLGNGNGGSAAFNLITNTARVGRNWVLTQTNGTTMLVTFGLQNAVTAAAYNGSYIYLDSEGTTWPITSNTANSFVASIALNTMPLTRVIGSLVALGTTSGAHPAATITTSAALEPGAFTDRDFMLVDAITPDFTYLGPISSNSASSVRVGGFSCTNCPGILTASKQYAGRLAAPGRSVPVIDVRLTLSGSPNFSPDSLVDRIVYLDSNRSATGTVIANTANTLDVEVDETDFAAFNQLATNSSIWLSDPETNGTVPMRIRITDQTGGFTANQWVGYQLVTATGTILGAVTANTANTVDVYVTNNTASSNTLASLVSGSRFAFAKAHAGQLDCTIGYTIKANAALSGATLTTNGHDFLYLDNASTTGHQVTSNAGTSADLLVCADEIDTFMAGLGTFGLMTTNGRFSITINDSTANMPPNAYVGRGAVLDTGGSLTSIGGPIVQSNTATSMVLGPFSVSSLNFDLAQRIAVGGYFVAPDSTGEVDVTLHTDLTMTPNALAGRLVEVFRDSSDVDPDEFFVTSNDASSLTGGRRSGIVLPSFVKSVVKYVTLSSGLRVQLTDATKSWTPNAFAGRQLVLNGEYFEVISNTATTVVGMTSDENALRDAMRAPTYGISTIAMDGPLLARPSGQALATTAVNFPGQGNRSLGLITLSRDGSYSMAAPIQSARTFNVTPKALTVNGTLSLMPIASGSFCVFSDNSWSWTPNALVGSFMQVRNPALSAGGAYVSLPIASNTATTITAFGCSSGSFNAAGKPYSIWPARYTVSGTTLSPNELAGKRLRINGYEVVVRSNTANEIHVYPLVTNSNDPAMEPAEVTGSTAYLFDGMPREQVNAIASDGANGYLLLGADFIAQFNGTSWSRTGPLEAATQHASGTLSSYVTSNQISDAAANYPVNSLSGKKLVLPTGIWNIVSNTANTITVSTSSSAPPFINAVVPPGTAYQIYNDDALGKGLLYQAAVSGGTLWAATDEGLFKRVGTSWTRYTVENTESAPGLADRLPNNSVYLLLPLSATEVLLYTDSGDGLTRLNGSTWSRYTVTSTESSSGANDGLFDDYISMIARDSSGAILIGHDQGVSKLTGSTWTQLGTDSGLYGEVLGMYETPAGYVFFGDDGTFRLLP